MLVFDGSSTGPNPNQQAINYLEADPAATQRLLFVTGPHGSGKTAVAKAVLGAEHPMFDIGPTLRVHHAAEMPEAKYEEWIALREAELGKTFISDIISRHMNEELADRDDPRQIATVVGARYPGIVQRLTDNRAPAEAGIVYVTAPDDILFERYRMREGKADLTRTDFEVILEYDRNLGLHDLEGMADLVLSNTGSLEIAADGLRAFMQTWAQQD